MVMALLNTLDWFLIAFSIMNMVLLGWLGVTVWLSAEQRNLGTATAAGGLILGMSFFAGHTAIVGRQLGSFSAEMEIWWLLGWVMLIAAPLAWYGVMAWYSGALRRRGQQAVMSGLALVGVVAIVSIVSGGVVPPYSYVIASNNLQLPLQVQFNGLVALLPVYSLACTGLALLVLREGPTHDERRFMAAEAQRRARPWLFAASLMIFVVSVIVGVTAAAVIGLAAIGRLPGLTIWSLSGVIVLDLVVEICIFVAVLLIGRAVVAYEIFTGGLLPSGSLARRWRGAVLFAIALGSGGGLLMSGLSGPPPAIYQSIVLLVISTVGFALVGRSATREQAQAALRLRPLLFGRRFARAMLSDPTLPTDGQALFDALCRDLIGTEIGYLAVYGATAELIGPALATPAGLAVPVAAAERAFTAADPAQICLPIEPEAGGGAVWAVGLWAERNAIGVLLIGPRRDGALYTREDLETARAAAEQLIDSLAGAALAQRLVSLQRQQMAASQVADRRARRLLHDDVLPEIHAALLELSGDPANRPALERLSSVHRQIADLLHDLPVAPSTDVLQRGLVAALNAAIDEVRDEAEQISWQADERSLQVMGQLAPLEAEALFYAAREALRNALRYGRGGQGRPLALAITATGDAERLVIEVADDGVGIDLAQRSAGGSGRGLALHATMLAIVGGSLSIESPAGRGTRVVLELPLAGRAQAQML